MAGRLSAIAAVLLLATPAGAERYLWTLSSSDTSPYVNSGEPSGVLLEVHLWLACSTDGMSAAELFVEDITGNLVLVSWTPCCGFLNNGPSECPLLAVGGCPSGPQRAGYFLFLDPTGLGGSLCIGPCPATGNNYTVDCGVDRQVHPNAWIGYSNNGTPPCSGGACEATTVSGDSWGEVKSLYR